MRPLKQFDEYLENNVVEKRRIDSQRAISLTKEAKKRKRFLSTLLQKIPLSNDNANYIIENSYDAIIELLRATLLLEGYYASGLGAHEAEVAFMRVLGFSEADTRFMNELRYFRNGILYYGKEFDVVYAKKVITFLEKMYPQLVKKLEKK
jgi:hypothetical protein